ncbi:MAG: hypothetical protein KGY54_01165 [Oleiphilaceae bacterium]|nr:hypothetical protein [Oleiphilaceae bacterium]
MIIRLFLLLLVLNMVAFVVRAEAGEGPVTVDDLYPQDLPKLQDRMSGDYEDDEAEDALLTLGSRLLSWRLSAAPRQSRAYASDSMRADHGVALINEGACLNLRWKF